MLLFDERPIVFSRTLAKVLGNKDSEAIALQQVNFWIEVNKKNNKKTMFKEGFYWTRRSLKDWHEEEFDMWSFSKVKRIFRYLVDNELLIVSNFNNYKADRTNWYRINKKKIDELHEKYLGKNNEKHLSKPTNAKVQNEPMQKFKMNHSDEFKMNQPIKENNKRLNKEINISYHSNNNIIHSEEKEQQRERRSDENVKKIYNTQFFKDSFGYSRVSENNKKILDYWIKYAVEVCLMHPDTKLKLGDVSTTANELQKRLIKLKYEHITFALTKVNKSNEPIQKPKNYVLKVMFNAFEDYEINQFRGKSNYNTSGYSGKYHAPVPDYLQDRISNLSNTPDNSERIVTAADEAAYDDMMRLLKSKDGKET